GRADLSELKRVEDRLPERVILEERILNRFQVSWNVEACLSPQQRVLGLCEPPLHEFPRFVGMLGGGRDDQAETTHQRATVAVRTGWRRNDPKVKLRAVFLVRADHPGAGVEHRHLAGDKRV